ncbi:NAD(P)-binding protein [Tilletiopsis washingtonensis]|uniref:NAD(P)-binding protein n=1 Tax=Tilletiopsis washingtonensis TaxID=58919 RepID=A0A316Z3L7_9BASI|nr:NAD(P)-binding protein [Tilletiopsis washingtonensis]PWN96189.1 NAD(P)-binding protein [Tilletiopsis washingtonensis]
MVLLASPAPLRAASRAIPAAAVAAPQARGLHDLVIKRRTGQPIVRAGPYGGGRNSVSGHVATVFGCTGFLGRYIVNRLAQKGTQVIVPYRDEDEKRHLKLMGDLGQIVPLEWDLRRDDQIAECMRHSDVVYNLVGRNYPTKRFSLDDVHVSGAARIASLADSLGVARLIHVSHLNADKDSPSAFLRAKAEGEEAVRRAFEGATIVRPGPIYGHEDRLLNSMATWPATWRVNYGETKLRPVHSVDVAHALEVMLDAENTSMGQTFSLAGPRSYTIAEMMQLVEALTYNKIVRPALNVPKPILMTASKLAQLAWWPMLSPDEVTQRFLDCKPDEPGTKSWADLGIEPDLLEEVAIMYLRRYRSNLHFETPIETGGARLKGGKQRYRVID